MTNDFKNGDRVSVGSLEGKVVHVNPDLYGGYAQVQLDGNENLGTNSFALDLLTKIEPPKPTNQELFDSLPVLSRFKLIRKSYPNPYAYGDYIKVGDDEFVDLDDSASFSSYFTDGEKYGFEPLITP